MHGMIESSTCHFSTAIHTKVKSMASRCIILRGKEDILLSSNLIAMGTQLFKSFLVTLDRGNIAQCDCTIERNYVSLRMDGNFTYT